MPCRLPNPLPANVKFATGSPGYCVAGAYLTKGRSCAVQCTTSPAPGSPASGSYTCGAQGGLMQLSPSTFRCNAAPGVHFFSVQISFFFLVSPLFIANVRRQAPVINISAYYEALKREFARVFAAGVRFFPEPHLLVIYRWNSTT